MSYPTVYRVERHLGKPGELQIEAFFPTSQDAKDYIHTLREGGYPGRRTYTAVPLMEALDMLNQRLRSVASLGDQHPSDDQGS